MFFFIYLTLNTSDNIKIVKTKIQSKKSCYKKKLDKNTGQKSQKNEKKKK